MNTIAFYNFFITKGKVTFNFLEKKNGLEKEEKDVYFIFDHRLYPNADHIAYIFASCCGKTYEEIRIDLKLQPGTIKNIEAFTKAKVTAKRTAFPPLFKKKSVGKNQNVVLSFSGGLDSLAALYLVPEGTKLVSIDFGRPFKREASVFRAFHPHVLKTDFRRRLVPDYNHWTFMGMGAMIYKDFLEADYIVFGQVLEAETWHFHENPPRVFETGPFSYLNFKDLHYTEGLTEVATTMVIAKNNPQMIAKSLQSLAPIGSEKLYRKELLVQIIKNKFGNGIEIERFHVPKEKFNFYTHFATDFLALYMIKYIGIDAVGEIYTNIPEEAIILSRKLSLEFYEKVNMQLSNVYPKALEEAYLGKLNDAGVTPYTKKDEEEFREVAEFLKEHYDFDSRKCL